MRVRRRYADARALVMAAPPPRTQPRRIDWTIVISIEPGTRCVEDAGQLESLPTGSSVVLQLNDHLPHDIDPRVVEFVRSAWHHRDLVLELQGHLKVVGSWWHALADPRPDPDPSQRHLRVVDGEGAQ